MSAICQQVESAFIRWLVSQASGTNEEAESFALATNVLCAEVVPTGLLITSDDDRRFRLNFYAGESEERVSLPAVIVSCVNAQRMEAVPNIQTLTVETSLEVQCDSSCGVNSVEWLDQASRWLHGVLSGQTAVARDIEAASPGLVVSYVSTPQVGRNADGRRRIHRWEQEVVASI